MLSRYRPTASVFLLVHVVSVFILAVDNSRFWAELFRAIQLNTLSDWLHFSGLAAFLYALISTLIYLVSYRWTVKLVGITLLLLAGVSSYFSDTFGTMIDGSMVQNVLETDWQEAAELLTWRFLLQVLFFIALPVSLLLWVKIEPVPISRAIRHRLVYLTSSVAVILLLIFSSFDFISSSFRNHRPLRHYLAPVNSINAVQDYIDNKYFSRKGRVAVIGTDASLILRRSDRKLVTILVLGETARAQNFGLSGYVRNTTPELARINGYYFSAVEACGTSTAVSVPCLFAYKSSNGFQTSNARDTEGLLDVLKRAGVDVLWKDNNSGCKGVCARVPTMQIKPSQSPDHCVDGECFDMALLDHLEQEIHHDKAPQLIVLHQKGSHGPAYFRRVPNSFIRFSPVCETEQLSSCSTEAIVNSYDNTILYTDHVLASLIDDLNVLAHDQEMDIAMLYVSDHGESLGENGLYLHGLPKLIAPGEQTHVPMYLWLSNGFKNRQHLSESCIQQYLNQPLSHDYVFHTIMQLLEVSTSLYDPKLDLLAPCRGV